LKNTRELPSIDFLNECFYIDDNFHIYWKHRPLHHFKSKSSYTTWNKRFEGLCAETKIMIGGKYVKRVCIADIRYYSHRIIYKIMVGDIQSGYEIDHINLDRIDNNIANLRQCEAYQNCQNKSVYKNNKSGVKGVGWHNASKKWYGRICSNKKSVFKTFETKDDAESWIMNERDKKHGEFARTN